MVVEQKRVKRTKAKTTDKTTGTTSAGTGASSVYCSSNSGCVVGRGTPVVGANSHTICTICGSHE